MKFLRTEVCILRDQIKNYDLRAYLTIHSVNNRIQEVTEKCEQHIAENARDLLMLIVTKIDVL